MPPAAIRLPMEVGAGQGGGPRVAQPAVATFIPDFCNSVERWHIRREQTISIRQRDAIKLNH